MFFWGGGSEDYALSGWSKDAWWLEDGGRLGSRKTNQSNKGMCVDASGIMGGG